jgi:hypothetical protein
MNKLIFFRDMKKKKYKTHTINSADIFPQGYRFKYINDIDKLILIGE